MRVGYDLAHRVRGKYLNQDSYSMCTSKIFGPFIIGCGHEPNPEGNLSSLDPCVWLISVPQRCELGLFGRVHYVLTGRGSADGGGWLNTCVKKFF